VHRQSTHDPSGDDVFEVVFVCTGNRARSPLAESLFRKYAAGLNTRVESFGTYDIAALPALSEAIEAASRLGVDLSGHRARSLRQARLESADLVVGFEPFHVSTAVVDARANVGRTFLLGELVSLLDVPATGDDPLARARAAIAFADARRVRSRPDAARALADPLGQPADVFTRLSSQVDELVRRLVDGLFGIEPGRRARDP
jgi:protein-tyrosine phosphatase